MDIAIIGCGKQAPKHISGLMANAQVETIFVADIFSEASERLAGQYDGKVKAIEIDDIFGQDTIKGIVICTPTPSHEDLCLRAINAGKPFLVEKPLTGTYEGGQQILAQSKAKNVPGMVGFIYRFNPIFDQVKSKGGGAINEMMVHMIDLAVWYFGKAKTIEILEKTTVRPTREIEGKTVTCDTEDWCLARLVMENGVNVVLQGDMISPRFRQAIEIAGNNGFAEGSINDATLNRVSLFQPAAPYTEKDNAIVSDKDNNLYVAQLGCFVDMVATGSAPEKCGLDEAVEVLRIQETLGAA
jgi:predicted dehydrogenase